MRQLEKHIDPTIRYIRAANDDKYEYGYILVAEIKEKQSGANHKYMKQGTAKTYEAALAANNMALKGEVCSGDSLRVQQKQHSISTGR